MKVVFAGTFPARLLEPVRARLEIKADLVAGDGPSLQPLLADADVIVAMAFDRAMADAAPRLKLVQVPGAGLDRVDRAALRPGVALANAYGHEVGIAEYIMGATITLSREFQRLDASLRTGIWASQWAVGAAPPPLWPELAGKTLGILGFGHIGQALATRAAAFDMRILAIRQSRQTPPPGVAFVGGPDDLDHVVASSDVLVLALPLTPDTRNVIDARRMATMRPGAILINVGRAGLVEEAALFDALSQRRLGGAALDVWYAYPTRPGPCAPANLPFATLPNVLMTPHVSGWTEGMIASRAAVIAGNIARIAAGQPVANAVMAPG
jgi:phosphoglycerate dehydrogenase-like enzyme